MTDKQIMIDGVDVLKEKINMCFILLLNKLETSETIEQTIYEHLDAFVDDWNKQLTRKTQECEKIKNWVKSKMFYTDCVNWFERFVYAFDNWQTDLQKQIDQLKAAKEQSEQKLEKIKDRCKETLELMDKDSGTNAYAGGRCTEAGQILQIIEVE